MHMKQIIGLLVLLCCELCLTIKVPTTWNESGNSAVSNAKDNYKQQNVQTLQQSQPIPTDYFQYTAKKPQFAIDVAAFHGVQNPEQHYKASPIIPYTGKEKPVLGIHHLLNEDRNIYQPYQKYVQKVEGSPKYVNPMSASYEIFHPYKAEVPALQELYKDPVLNKIRNDLHDSKNRLQAYERDAGQSNVSDDEYLEKIKHTESKLFPQKNVPAQYEIHSPERRPTYYKIPARDTHRDHVLNQRFKHPWNQHGIKIRPLHYKPLKNHLHSLRQQHALKYDDERNEYPQLQLSENIAQEEDGYDIYEKGKQKYTQLKNNLDESINKAVLENRPETYQKLELQPNEHIPKEVDDEFIPVKNYAQVRKTETIKHLPKKAAFDDADTYEEILNAPRLREAIKSTKAQIVYSEEGYEDSAYDHAGEQKHALDHEGHGGFLKETAKSGGLFKTPSFSGSYQDGKGSEHRDNIEHDKKWENNDTDNEEDIQAEDYSESQYEESDDSDAYKGKKLKINNRNKREDEKEAKVSHSDDHGNDENMSSIENDRHNKSLVESEIHTLNKSHEVDKRETSFEVPTINLDKTYLSESDILKIAKERIKPKMDNIQDKYPYYFKNFKAINENSPLRYAENLKYIPKKSEGGTEFYDSRSKLECPEVEDDIDPIPEKLKNGNNPTEEDSDEEEKDELNLSSEKKNTTMTNKPRLNGLGDKIDCFKAKYFGENPLDSPFFKEDLISVPQPILAPKLFIFDHLKAKQKLDYQNPFDESRNAENTDIFELLNKLRITDKPVQNFQQKLNGSSQAESYAPQNNYKTNNTQQANVYTDISTNNKKEFDHSNSRLPAILLESTKDISNKTYNYFQNKEEVTKLPTKIRRKRASQFVYEPYKIIRDSQYQDSKKTTTTSNISPLIRQLQTSRVVDRVSRSNRDDYKPNSKNSNRTYVDIGKNDRAEMSSNPTIVDVSVDQRRGEPRYEIRPNNHKSEYTPVENKRAMSIDDYNTHTSSDKAGVTTVKSLQLSPNPPRGRQHFKYTTTTMTPVYDVASFLPNSPKVSPSNAARRTVTTTTPIPASQENDKIKQISGEDTEESDEDYNDDDSDDEEEDDEIKFTTTTTTTTTTVKPAFRRRTQFSTTTENINEHINEDQPERLKLVTRFRNYKTSEKPIGSEYTTAPTDLESKYKPEQDSMLPKYTEKKKKSSKSTLVTDTKKYGDDDDDDDIDEDVEEKKIDAMIGVKQNLKDYMPSYEQEAENKERKLNHYKTDDDNEEEESVDNDDDEDDDDDDENNYDDDDDDDDDDEEEDETIADKEENDEEEESNKTKLKVTTPEPTKRTLVLTTDAPPPTIASHFKTTIAPLTDLKPENKPLITKKKIEIHKELPVDKSGPHVTQFKQDIKEVEIIKEMPAPKRKQHRKVKPLELYKDDNLAKDINKLEDVEIFRENLELEKGPKHGGNYRRASKEDLKLLTLKDRANDEELLPKDVEASQSENRKRVELDEFTPERIREGNQRSFRGGKRTRKTEKNAELVELSNPPRTGMHGGNLRYKGRGGRKSEKLIELDDDRDDEDSTQDDDYKSSPHSSRHDRLHGGNYRSAKLVVEKPKTDDLKVNNPAKEARRSASILLNRFVQAVPALTTTPGYIVDPSKRMYYYLDV